jgi:flagellar biosynthetic protein FliR
MESLIAPLVGDAWGWLPVALVAELGSRGLMGLLVAARLTGFFCIGPMLGRPILTWRVRIGLILLLTLVVTPSLPSPALGASDVVTVSHDQPYVIPDAVDVSVPGMTSPSLDQIPASLVCDLVLGAAMGLSVSLFLSGIRLGGEWIDRHSGLGLGAVMNPSLSTGECASAELVALLGTVMILVMEPVNGHLQAMRFVLETFRELPPGMTSVPGSLQGLLSVMVQQSLILGLRVAMPFVVALTLVELTLGCIRRTSRWELAPLACAIRAGASLLILAATFPGIQEAIAHSLQDSLKAADEQLTSHSS